MSIRESSPTRKSSSPVHSTSTLKIASVNADNLRDDTDNDEVDDLSSPIERVELVRVESGYSLQAIRAKELCDNNCVKFDEAKSIWLVEDSDKWLVVTVFPEYGCSCQDSLRCSHVLAVKTKLGLQLRRFKFNPTASLSSVIASRTTGNSKQSKSGSKRKYQTRNAVNAVRAGSGSEVIANSEHYMPYLIQLVNSDNVVAKLSADSCSMRRRSRLIHKS